MENNTKFLLDTLTKIAKESGCIDNAETLLTHSFSEDVMEICMRSLTYLDAATFEELGESPSIAAILSLFKEEPIKTLAEDLQYRIETLGFDEVVANVKKHHDKEVAFAKDCADKRKQRDKIMGKVDNAGEFKITPTLKIISEKLEKLNVLSLNSFPSNISSGATYIKNTIESTLQRYPAMRSDVKSLALEIYDLCLCEMDLEQTKTGASDLTNTKSGILVASLPNVKPRPKFVAAGIKDTEDGLVITFPKPLVFKLGTAHAINLGVSVPSTTVEFKSDYLHCLAISTSTMFGTVLLLQSRNVDTVKIDADGEIGILVHKNK